ncbi:hypothetical protein V7150_02570 [Neobacillus drentensis]|uniref:hypothetical protein n=1 Tax=Neobacillus drentensis TaxID=220684 RepID=UPI002FFE5694
MIKPRYSKILGAFLGTLTIIAASGFGLLFLIGMGLQQTFSSEMDHASTDQSIYLNLIIIVMLIISGFITAIAPFTLKKTAGNSIFVGYCFILGFIALVVFFISIGALGSAFEYVILAIGIVYFLLGYLVIKENNLFSRRKKV